MSFLTTGDEKLCGEHFPKMLAEDYYKEGYFDSFATQAFVNETEYGVLIRADLNYRVNKYRGFQSASSEQDDNICEGKEGRA